MKQIKLKRGGCGVTFGKLTHHSNVLQKQGKARDESPPPGYPNTPAPHGAWMCCYSIRKLVDTITGHGARTRSPIKWVGTHSTFIIPGSCRRIRTMLQGIGIILALMVLPGCVTPPPPRHTSEVSEEDVRLMIARFGPVLYLHNNEQFLMDDPEYVLDRGASLCWGIVNDARYDSFRCENVQSKPTSSETLYDDARAAANWIQSAPDSDKYKYWLSIGDAFKKGNLRRAKALVRVLPAGDFSTELQFWFFYPFNGPGRVWVRAASGIGDRNWLRQCGRHYGDWELVSIIVTNTATELESVYMSRHSEGETFDRWENVTYPWEDGAYRSASDSRRKLKIEDQGFLKWIYIAHPIVYSGISSHAHYPWAGNHNYERVFSQSWVLGTASADLFDRTEAGRAFRACDEVNYRIISSDLPGFKVIEPKWLDYNGRWGQYEKLADGVKFGVIPTYTRKEVGKGPSGPKMKPEWSGAFRAN